MVSLFLGLYGHAGVRPEKSAPQRQRATVQRPRAVAKSALPNGRKTPAANQQTDLPAPLAGLLSKLPSEGSGWTQASREKFMNTFGTVLDFCFPIVAQEIAEEEEV
jgi:hypothetical protein